MKRLETEPQRRDRVLGRLKDQIMAHLAGEMTHLAGSGELPPGWFAPADVSRILEKRGYWVAHPEPLASFLSIAECERVTAATLAALSAELPSLWWRHNERYRSAASTDWNTLARETADQLRRQFPDNQATAIYGGPDEPSIIFAGNPASTDGRQPIALLRDHLRAAAVPELGFSMDAESKAWVMLVWSKDEKRLQQLLLSAWQTAVTHG